MREAYHKDLASLGEELFLMSTLATTAISEATDALLNVDLHLAERVISADDELDERSRRCEEQAYTLLALQSPVAGELRAVISVIKAAEKIERMGDLASHVAQLVRLRHPRPVLPEPLAPRFREIGQLAADAGAWLQRALTRPTGHNAPAHERADDLLDQRCADVLEHVEQAEPTYPIHVGVDVALLARFYERFADQAVTVTKQLDYAVTGRRPTGPG